MDRSTRSVTALGLAATVAAVAAVAAIAQETEEGTTSRGSGTIGVVDEAIDYSWRFVSPERMVDPPQRRSRAKASTAPSRAGSKAPTTALARVVLWCLERETRL